MRRSERGFTLLEVLGAVALLALVYTVLATVAMRGLRSEGESGRRLEASLIADWRLAELEMQINQGLMPELGVIEDEQDGFTIRIEVAIPDIPLPTAGGIALSPDEGDGGDREAEAEPLFAGSDGESPLRSIDVIVSWSEGANLRTVRRTTFGIDPVAVQAAIAQQPETTLSEANQ